MMFYVFLKENVDVAIIEVLKIITFEIIKKRIIIFFYEGWNWR